MERPSRESENRRNAQEGDNENFEMDRRRTTHGDVNSCHAPTISLKNERKIVNTGDRPLFLEQLRASGKSWDEIIESATRSGGEDLGF